MSGAVSPFKGASMLSAKIVGAREYADARVSPPRNIGIMVQD